MCDLNILIDFRVNSLTDKQLTLSTRKVFLFPVKLIHILWGGTLRLYGCPFCH